MGETVKKRVLCVKFWFKREFVLVPKFRNLLLDHLILVYFAIDFCIHY